MASILDRYGIKEVADVTFYEIDETTNGPSKPVLYLDTLKVSTIEQTAEQSDARGGKGNPKLITWDYGKDISVTLEDALFSAKSLAIMFGDGAVYEPISGMIRRTATVKLVAGGSNNTTPTLPKFFTTDVYDAVNKTSVRTKVYINSADMEGVSGAKLKSNVGIKLEKLVSERGHEFSKATMTGDSITTEATWEIKEDDAADKAEIGDRVFVTYQIPAKVKEIVVSADTFPGTYYVTGDTYARSDATGKDQFFQFILPKAKVTSENTITLEAEGDPSVFNMNLTVLRPEDGEMMKLVQYDLYEDSSANQ